MFYYSAVALAAFMMSLLGTRLTILALRRKHAFLDVPNARSNHIAPTPRGGGIAVVFTLVMGLLLMDVGYSIVLAMLLLAAISFIDDLIRVPPALRLVAQAVAVWIAMTGMEGLLFNGLLSVADDKIITMLLWIWFINLFNFMDGIDGISGSEMICVGIGLCLLTVITNAFPSTLAEYALVAVAAGFGFLWWNWHPAKIFLGDVGSIPIGFLLAYLLLLAAKDGYVYAAMILPAYYLADGTITLVRRTWRGEKPWKAHSEHFYQKAVRNGRSHDGVVRLIIGVNMLLVLCAVTATLEPKVAPVALLTAYAAVFLLLRYFARRKKAGRP